jgi:hypothetical protein
LFRPSRHGGPKQFFKAVGAVCQQVFAYMANRDSLGTMGDLLARFRGEGIA